MFSCLLVSAAIGAPPSPSLDFGAFDKRLTDIEKRLTALEKPAKSGCRCVGAPGGQGTCGLYLCPANGGSGGCPCAPAARTKATGLWKDYPHADHVHTVWGVRVMTVPKGRWDAPGEEFVKPFVSVTTFGDIDPRTGVVTDRQIAESDLYINGVKYDPTARVDSYDKAGSEIARWFGLTGPCRLTKRADGKWDLVSLTGEEERVCKEYNGGGGWIYIQFNPRLVTVEDCRAVWSRFGTGSVRPVRSLETR